MNHTDATPVTASEVDFHAAGLLVKGQGSWTDSTLAQFRHFLRLRRLSPTEDELMSALQRAKETYFSGAYRLYLCTAQPCCDKINFDVSAAELTRVSRSIGAPIAKTGC